MSFKASLVLSGLAASALLLASGALRADNAPVERPARSTDVNFQDLNLQNSAAVATLYQRIGAAADRVCSSRADSGIYYTYAGYQSCVADAVRRAVTDVNQPALTSYYQQQLHPSRSVRVAQQ